MFSRSVAAEMLYRCGLVHMVGRWRRFRNRGGPIFLMGHRVLPSVAANGDPVDRMALLSGHAITPEELQRRLEFVHRHVMPKGDPAVLAHGLPAQRRFYVTFDDGYLDNLLHAGPVLEALNIKAIIFFVGKLVQQPNAVPWWDSVGGDALTAANDQDEAITDYGARCAAKKRQFDGLSEGELGMTGSRRYASAAELMSLPDTFFAANHGASHANFSRLDAEALTQEIEAGDAVVRRSPQYLPVLAFPFGSYDSRVKDWLTAANRYRLAFATGNGIEGDPQCQRRINLNVKPFSLFAAQCVGLMR